MIFERYCFPKEKLPLFRLENSYFSKYLPEMPSFKCISIEANVFSLATYMVTDVKSYFRGSYNYCKPPGTACKHH